jgi:hypothetical protein
MRQMPTGPLARLCRPTWRGWVLLLLALLATGCQVRLAVDVAVDRNGAGQVVVSVGADAELLQRAAAAGADPLGELRQAGERLAADGWETADRTHEDGSRAVTLSARFSGPDEFNHLAHDLAGALAAPEVRLLEPFVLEVSPQVLRIEGAAALEPTEVMTEIGLRPEDAVRLARDHELIDYAISVTLPGEVLETNADEHDGPLLRWAVEPGERVAIHAVAQRPPGPWWPWVAMAAAAAVMVVAVAAAVRRRRSQPRRGRRRAATATLPES